MNKKELIEKLEEFDDKMEIVLDCAGGIRMPTRVEVLTVQERSTEGDWRDNKYIVIG